MSKIYYDTEFIDNGVTIELISIGMVAENDDEYYAINSELMLPRLLVEDWHIENTVPSLPVEIPGPGRIRWVPEHPDWPSVKTRSTIREEVFDFIVKHSPEPPDEVELWAWYGAYDHVVLAQLWGPMNNLPYGKVPMYTNDLKQEVERKGKVLGRRLKYELPKPNNNLVLHNALDDARLLKQRAEWLEKL